MRVVLVDIRPTVEIGVFRNGGELSSRVVDPPDVCSTVVVAILGSDEAGGGPQDACAGNDANHETQKYCSATDAELCHACLQKYRNGPIFATSRGPGAAPYLSCLCTPGRRFL